jgi:PAS domain S-box-containing protein
MMSEPQVRMLICEHYRPEVEFLNAEGEFDGVSVSFFNGMCGRPPLRWDQIEKAASVTAETGRLYIVGGCCLQVNEPTVAGLSAAKITRLDNCFRLVARQTEIADIRPGDYVVTPGWLGAWQETMTIWGFDQDTARCFFAESADCILLLDTGAHPDSLNRLRQFSGFVGLPYRIVEVGITTFRARLQSIVGDVHSATESAPSKGYNLQNASADYVLALDVMRQIVSMPTLEATLTEIVRLFDSITAAAEVEITYKDHLGQKRKFTLRDRLPESTNFRFHHDPSFIEPLPSGRGFLLPMVHGENKVGLIRVDGIPMVGAIDHYMNFALAIAGVCALAIKSKVDQRNAEEKNKSLRQLLDSTRTVPWEFNLVAGQFTFVGSQVERITGYPSDYWTDLQSWADTIIDEDRKWAVNFCQNKTMCGEEHDFVYRMRAKEGSVLWINDVVSVVMGPTGPEKLIGFMHDITASKSAEAERRATEILYKELFSHMTEAFAIHEVVLDESGKVVDYTFLDINPAFEIETGLNKDDLIGKSVREVLPDEDPFWIETYGKVAMTGEPVHFTRYSPALKKHYEILAYSPEQKRFAVLFRDVTEKWELEQKLRQASKMEAIGTLAGGIAHDFNNILGAILGYAEMAKEDSQPGSSASDKLDRVIEAGNRAAGFVKQILAFSRQAVSESVPLKPEHIVLEVIQLLRPSLPTTIAITQQFAHPIHTITADPTQIHQIVMNLCTNAFHAMEKTGGTLNISLENRELSTQDTQQYPNAKPGNYVILSISDTGPGIPSEIRDRIFDPYFTTKEVGKGTGMGLAIIHGIATSMGGFVTCESTLGQGTVFRTFLPATLSDVAVPLTGSTDIAPTGKEHILLVDDEELLAELGQTMLERLGYQVTLCTDSIVALSLIREYSNKFDVLITDQTMPGMTGFDLARNVLQIRPNLPIIICTGYSNLVDEETAKQAGIRGFIMKPLSKDGLAELLDRVINESSSQEQIAQI